MTESFKILTEELKTKYIATKLMQTIEEPDS